MRVSVIGAGAWGTALSIQLVRAGNDVKIWAYEEQVRDEINKQHQNVTYLSGIGLQKRIVATGDMQEAYDFSNIAFLAPPVFALSSIVGKKLINKTLVCVSKGIAKDTHKLAHQIVEEHVGGSYNFAALSGPSFAKEVALGNNTKVMVASVNAKIAKTIKRLIETKNFRVEISDDVIGVELGGALKNVLAILSGIVAGVGYGRDFQAVCFTEGLREMVHIGERFGAKRETFYTLSGVGDLFLTCTSDLSRNFTFGYSLGNGVDVKEALKTKNAVEGVETASSVNYLSEKMKMNTPLFSNVYQVIFKKKSPKRALSDIWRAL